MSVSWQEQWRRIVARIDGLSASATFIFDTTQPAKLGVLAYLQEQWDEIFKELEHFFAESNGVPAAARDRFVQFSSKHANLAASSHPDNLASRLAYMIGLRTEIDWAMGDYDIVLRRVVDRAFLHLQRLIVADVDIARKWQEAFKKNEMACERLGGAHLLHHGIWGFKADATGARTDLVLGQPLVVNDDIRRAVDGLVLTEWKLVKSQSTASDMAAAAILQAKNYSHGLLAGFELGSIRYVVLVSQKALPRIPDETRHEYTYSHVNIAVDPDVPSLESKVLGANAKKAS